MGEDFTTNVTCGAIESGTSINSTDESKDVIYNILYNSIPEPSSEYESISLGTWASVSDVDTFFTQHTYMNGWAGLKLGNYVTINDGTYNTQWEIAGFNLEHNQTAADGTVYNNGYGICWIPKEDINYTVWAEDTSSAIPYKESDAHSFVNNTMYSIIKRICGTHIINRNVLLSSEIEAYTSIAYTWTTAYLTLMSVGQLTNIFASHSTKYDDGEANYYLPLFNYESYYCNDSMYWTRGHGNGSHTEWAWYVDGANTRISSLLVDSNLGARPLMYLR